MYDSDYITSSIKWQKSLPWPRQLCTGILVIARLNCITDPDVIGSIKHNINLDDHFNDNLGPWAKAV